MHRQPYNVLKNFDSTDWASDLDLTAVSGAPPLPPDQIDIVNEESDAQVLVIALPNLPDGTPQADESIRVPGGTTRVLYNAAVAGITNTGTGSIAQVTAYWRALTRDVTINP